MKKLALLLFALVTVAITFSSCEKEDEVSPDLTNNIPLTADGNTVYPTNDTVRYTNRSGGWKQGGTDILTNDSVQISDVESTSSIVADNGQNASNKTRSSSYAIGNASTGNTTSIGIETNFPSSDIGYTEYLDITITLTSGYQYTTTLVIIQE
jgi:hypothetical protein